MTIITFLIVLGLLILSHELGHFLAAKRAGVRVDEFGLGFPPRLFGFRYGETVYSLNLIPFGGFVKIYGEEAPAAGARDLAGVATERAMFAKSKLTQGSILAAGIVFNLLLAWLLLAVALTTTGLPTAVREAPAGYEVRDPALTVVSVLPASPAARAGLKPGDVIVSLRSGADYLAPAEPAAVQNFTANRADQEIVIGFKRPAGEVKTILEETAARPIVGLAPDRAALGLGLEVVGTLKLPPGAALIAGGRLGLNLTAATARGLFNFFRELALGRKETLNQVAGPIGLVSLVGLASSLGFGYLLLFTAIISINLALLNLLPIPALDGGRLLFLLIESLKGSPIKPNLARLVNLLGFAFLIILMLLVTYNDLHRLLSS